MAVALVVLDQSAQLRHLRLCRLRGALAFGAFPRRLLARVDEYARAHGESRSGFLARAAQEAMRA